MDWLNHEKRIDNAWRNPNKRNKQCMSTFFEAPSPTYYTWRYRKLIRLESCGVTLVINSSLDQVVSCGGMQQIFKLRLYEDANFLLAINLSTRFSQIDRLMSVGCENWLVLQSFETCPSQRTHFPTTSMTTSRRSTPSRVVQHLLLPPGLYMWVPASEPLTVFVVIKSSALLNATQ